MGPFGRRGNGLLILPDGTRTVGNYSDDANMELHSAMSRSDAEIAFRLSWRTSQVTYTHGSYPVKTLQIGVKKGTLQPPIDLNMNVCGPWEETVATFRNHAHFLLIGSIVIHWSTPCFFFLYGDSHCILSWIFIIIVSNFIFLKARFKYECCFFIFALRWSNNLSFAKRWWTWIPYFLALFFVLWIPFLSCEGCDEPILCCCTRIYLGFFSLFDCVIRWPVLCHYGA